MPPIEASENIKNIIIARLIPDKEINHALCQGGGGWGGEPSRLPKGFSSITFEKNKLEIPNFA